jgi:hypothetical protein
MPLPLRTVHTSVVPRVTVSSTRPMSIGRPLIPDRFRSKWRPRTAAEPSGVSTAPIADGSPAEGRSRGAARSSSTSKESSPPENRRCQALP